jgi:hypothetical protein
MPVPALANLNFRSHFSQGAGAVNHSRLLLSRCLRPLTENLTGPSLAWISKKLCYFSPARYVSLTSIREAISMNRIGLLSTQIQAVNKFPKRALPSELRRFGIHFSGWDRCAIFFKKQAHSKADLSAILVKTRITIV